MNALITSVSKRVVLIEKFVETANKYNSKIICVNSKPSAALYSGHQHYIVPEDKDEEELLAKLTDICQAEDIKFIVPTRDEELFFFDRHREIFEEIGCKLIIPSSDTIKLCRDKRLFTEFCHNNQIKTPKTFYGKLHSDDFPIFIKPNDGKGSKNIFLVLSPQDLRFYEKHHPEIDFLLQEAIVAPEFTVDVFCDFDNNPISIVPRQRLDIINGESLNGITVDNDNIIEETKNLCQKLRLTGPNTVQCFLEKGDVKFIEVNPRFGSGITLSFESGVNSVDFLFRCMQGNPPPPILGQYKRGLMMMRYFKDRYVQC